MSGLAASGGRLGEGREICTPPDVSSSEGGAFRLPTPAPRPILALGGQMKARLALAFGGQVVFSADLGDLSAPGGLDRLESEAAALQRLHGLRAETLICDAHAGYSSTKWAKAQAVAARPVFHHHAHASALAGEFPDQKQWLCFTWDGAGMGMDGTLWGGEALLGAPGAWRRMATFRPFAPPGGETAAREPWRSAAALAWPLGTPFAPPGEPDIPPAKAAWARQFNAPATTAVGRLFDAAAALLDLVHYAEHEAQGPIALEALAGLSGPQSPVRLPLRRRGDGLLQADWAPLVPMLCDATRTGGARAYAFHASMAATLVAQAAAIRAAGHEFAVGLCGGVFQNRLLSALALDGLRRAGLTGFMPVRHPCHDGALSFGQVIEALAAC
jgi:hydrogenase maturation protein HypF